MKPLHSHDRAHANMTHSRNCTEYIVGMRNIILFETHEQHLNLLPLAYTRPIALFRVGILTISEKWELLLKGRVSYKPDESLSELFPTSHYDDNLFINAAILPDSELLEKIEQLQPQQAVAGKEGDIIAARGNMRQFQTDNWDIVTWDPNLPEPRKIKYAYDIFINNGREICNDFRLITKGRKSQPLPSCNTLLGAETDYNGNPLIFIEAGAKVEGALLNTKHGPIYIGADAQICEGACVRGPLALCKNARINMGAKIYSDTTIGPYCKVGGEINNAVLFAFSNKAHDGYLGNAVIGEWCNIGAGVNASNLKNDYSNIRLWNYATSSFMRTDLQFCGLIMADHSKIGISAMLNTATVIGVGVNLYGSGYPRPFIPSFSQGSPASGFTDVPLNKFFDIARRAMARRGRDLTEADKQLYEHVKKMSSAYKH